MRRIIWIAAIYLFIGTSTNLWGQNLELVNSLLYSDNFTGVYVVGEYIYATGSQKLHILSAAHPQSPRLCGYFNLKIIAFDTLGQYAYAATADSGLYILDVSDPILPEVAAHFDTRVDQISISGNIAYSIIPDSGLQVLDLANPLEPQVLSFLPSETGALFISGNLAFIASRAILKIIDISNPLNPYLIGHLYPPYSNYHIAGVYIYGNYAYITSNFTSGLPDRSDSYLQIADISQPSNPVVAGQIELEWTLFSEIIVRNGNAYIKNDGGYLNVIDVTNPQNLNLISSYQTYWDTIRHINRGMAVADNHIYLAAGGYEFLDYYADFLILDISNPDTLVELGYYDPGRPYSVILMGNYAYVADGDFAGLKIIDITNPSIPSITGSCAMPTISVNVAANDTIAYVASQAPNSWTEFGLEVLNISDKVNPILIGSCHELGMFARCMTVAGSYAYIGADDFSYSRGLRIVNVADAAAPYLVATYPLSSSHGYMGVSIRDSLVYLTDATYGLRILNVIDPVHPEEVGNIQTFGGASDIGLYGIFAIVADYQDGLQIINIENPASPLIISSYTDVPYAYKLFIYGHYVYVGYQNGIAVIDISDPYEPINLGGYDTPGTPSGIYCQGEYVYVADQTSLQILHTPYTGIYNDFPANSKSIPVSISYPNPFNTSSTIKYFLPSASNVSIDIYDIAGRKIETLLYEKQNAGEHCVVWNAEKIPSGVYFYRIKAGNLTITEKCLLLK
jgi:hypothetical protein